MTLKIHLLTLSGLLLLFGVEHATAQQGTTTLIQAVPVNLSQGNRAMSVLVNQLK